MYTTSPKTLAISRAYTIFNNCCAAMYFSKQSALTHAHWRTLTYDDGTLLLPLLLLFRLESLPFLRLEFLSQNTQTLIRTWACVLVETYVRSDIGHIYIYYIPPPLTIHFSITRSVRYQPILHTLYYTLHTENAYCLSYRFLNNVVITTVIEMVEMVELLDARLGKRSVERVRYKINNLLHLVIVKYGDISLVLCISTRLRLVTILSSLMKYVIVKAWQRGYYAANSPSTRALVRVRGR